MDRDHDSRSWYNSPLDGVHAPVVDYEAYSEEYGELPPQPRHASSPHPQSDDYFDGVDPYSSPTPLPRGSTGMERRAMEFGMREDSSNVRYDYNSQQVENYDRSVPKKGTLYANQASCSLSKNLVPVSTLPDWCRGVFKFGVFNAMQSRCFDTAVNTDSNMVISAPTGAGKTVLFELSVIRLVQSENNTAQSAYKCVYMAPTKAICSERSRDWSAKFAHLGVKCCELTGDTMKSGRSAWKEANDSSQRYAHVAPQTAYTHLPKPEKWDSLTRNWDDSSDFLQRIRLFMVDE
ncbi:unnamed protein product, partial [Rhizoctonia solani]